MSSNTASELIDELAWESTTPAYTRWITDARYRKLRPAYRRWYRPICSRCGPALSAIQDVAK